MNKSIYRRLAMNKSIKNIIKKATAGLFVVFVIPSEYENIYYSSLSGYSSNTIVFGQPLRISDGASTITINPMPVWASGTLITCYDIPKITCQNNRVADISTSIKDARVYLNGRYLKLNNAYVGVIDIGNAFRICATGVASNAVDDITLLPCWSNSEGICLQIRYQAESLSTKVVINHTSLVNRTARIEAVYKQFCR